MANKLKSLSDAPPEVQKRILRLARDELGRVTARRGANAPEVDRAALRVLDSTLYDLARKA